MKRQQIEGLKIDCNEHLVCLEQEAQLSPRDRAMRRVN